MKYRVTKYFTGGLLAGITVVEITSVPYAVGFVCAHPYGGTSPYVILAVVPA